MEQFPENNLLKEKKRQSEEKDKNNNVDAIKEENYLPNFIKKYGKEVGLPNLKLNENGVCSLSFDDSITVDIVYIEKNNQCFLASPICSIPNSDREKFYEQLLISNNTYNKNGGIILGIDEDSNRVVISYTFIANTFTYFRFKNVLRNFVDIAERNILKFKEF
jgi:hypothetical protein